MQLNRKSRWATAAVLVGSMIACNSAGSVDITTGSGGFEGPTPTGDGPPPGGGGSINACPVEMPIANTGCSVRSAERCEYGPFPDPSCNTYATCTEGGWELTAPTACPINCPAHFDDRVPGAACSDPEICTYLEATCGCAGTNPALDTDDAGDDAAADAGADDDGGDAATPDPDAGAADGGNPVGHWQCVRPRAPGCPARRPLAGARCVAAVTCDYGSCVFGVRLNYECLQSTWVEVTIGSCP